ncbi:hypothetical protein, partial [Parageobacillus toebii]|uniref:hypothetical protein n=1 Tax=Parageobacillus toebii TaxID=153151 RepID=UPI002E1C5DAF|nr:hypothetical protein [Parageobacillus toebii]
MSSVFKRGWINLSIHMGLDSFTHYINAMENFLDNQLKELEEQYIEETKNVPPEVAENIFEYQYEDQFYYYQDEFPNILRKSFIISLYSFLEQELIRICRHIEKNNSFEVRLDDIKDKGIFKCHEYLTEIAKIDFSTVNNEWEKIKKINKIRNHFVHNGSDILDKVVKPKSNKERKINQTFRAFEYFKLAEEDKIYTKFRESMNDKKILKYHVKITSEFCKEALNIIKSFFDKLTDLLKLY